MTKTLEIQSKSKVDLVWDEGYWELRNNLVTQITVINCLIRIIKNPITYYNSFPLRNWALISEIQVKCVQDISVARDMANLGVSRMEVIQVISDI